MNLNWIQKFAIKVLNIPNEQYYERQRETIGTETGLQVTEMKQEISTLQNKIMSLENERTLYLNQIEGLRQDKNELKDQLQGYTKMIESKDKELDRKQSELSLLEKYRDLSKPIQEELIIKGTTYSANKILNYMAIQNKVYSPKELIQKLEISKPALWKNLHLLEVEGWITIEGGTRSKYLALTNKYKEQISKV